MHKHTHATRYTNQSGCVTVGGMNDGEEFGHTVRAMAAVRIGPADRSRILRTVGSLLLLGNVQFSSEAGGERCCVTPGAAGTQALRAAAALLGLGEESGGAEALAEALVTMVRKLPGGEVNVGRLKVLEAEALRDALAKAVYTRLFDWTVEAVNRAIDDDATEGPGTRAEGEGKSTRHVIGVLDIFGFEDQWSNGFEQLFINATNEALQHVFNDQIFRAEAEECVSTLETY